MPGESGDFKIQLSDLFKTLDCQINAVGHDQNFVLLIRRESSV